MKRCRRYFALATALVLASGCGGGSGSGGVAQDEQRSESTTPQSESAKATPTTTAAVPAPVTTAAIAPPTTAPPTTAAPKNIELADVLNMEVPGDTCNWLVDKTGPQLTDGKSAVVDRANFELLADDSIFADVTGDGAGDALLYFYCDGGGNDLWGSIVVMIADGPTYVIPSSDVLDPAGLPAGTTFHEWGGVEWDGEHVVLQWSALEADGASCCPRFSLNTTGTIDADGFHAISTGGEDALTGGEFTSDPKGPSDSEAATGDWTFYDVPQLGNEPVRGSGCGADSSIGDIIPDGWWFGWVDRIGSGSFEFDLGCVYYGDSATAVVEECAGTTDQNSVAWEDCLGGWDLDFVPRNNNERTRPVRIGAAMAIDPLRSDCPVLDESQLEGRMSLVHIVNGKAVSILYNCGGG